MIGCRCRKWWTRLAALPAEPRRFSSVRISPAGSSGRVLPRPDGTCRQGRPGRTSWRAGRSSAWSTKPTSPWPAQSSASCAPTSGSAGQLWPTSVCITGWGAPPARRSGPLSHRGLFKRVNLLCRWVEVGQASVVMAISSPHRHDGQQAVQHCITQLKAKIPIWKKVGKLESKEPRLDRGFDVGFDLSTGSVRHPGQQLEGELGMFVGSSRQTSPGNAREAVTFRRKRCCCWRNLRALVPQKMQFC